MYRGVVVGKFIWSGYEPDRQIICDFGSQGVWMWDSNIWTQLSGANPDRIIGATGFLYYGWSLVGDFGSMGIWKWSTGGWTQISGANPNYMLLLDDNGDGANDLHAAFPGYGLWRMDGDQGVWTCLSGSLPLVGIASDFWTAGYKEGVHSFGPQGVWQFFVGAGGGTPFVYCTQLSTATAWDDHAAANFGVGDGSGSLIMDFGPLGTWLCEDDTAYFSWHKLSDYAPLRVREVVFAESGNFDFELLCQFKSGAASGLYYWNYDGFPGTWTKIADSNPGPGFCEPFNADGGSIGGDADEEVAVDFEGSGLWLYDFADDSWTSLTPFNPVFMVRADLAGGGIVNNLVVDFGAGIGLWYYDGASKSWAQLSSQSPDESFDTD